MQDCFEEDVRSLILDLRELGRIDEELETEALDLLEDGKVSEALDLIKPHFKP